MTDLVDATDASSADRLMAMTHQAYGPLTGVPRLLALLRRHQLKATFFVPGFTAERYPTVGCGSPPWPRSPRIPAPSNSPRATSRGRRSVRPRRT